MKRIQPILFASAVLLATPSLFTACQEDAPEINYTMNVSVINDFTKVVEYNPQNEKLHRRKTKSCLSENEAYP